MSIFSDVLYEDTDNVKLDNYGSIYFRDSKYRAIEVKYFHSKKAEVNVVIGRKDLLKCVKRFIAKRKYQL